MSPDPSDKPETKALVHYAIFVSYITFTLSLSLALVPIPSVSVFSLMICVCTLGGLYSFRLDGKLKENDFVYSHSAYIVRTFWRSCVLLLITSFIAILYMLVAINYNPLEPCFKAAINTLNNGHFENLTKITTICSGLLVEKNIIHIKIVGFIAFIPIFIYVLVRCGTGLALLMYNRKAPSKKL